jgi:ABC-2 type transport system permease protein
MNTWATLVRREFWEHRGLWIAPLAGAAFLVLGTIGIAVHGISFSGGPRLRGPFGGMGSMDRDALAVAVFASSGLILAIGSLAIITYALDCLYAERKDRSILFWKSLPVSDTQTVLSKLLVACGAVPALLIALAIVTHLVCGAILSLAPPGGAPVHLMWDPVALPRAYLQLAMWVIVNALWFAPFVAYAMLASVLAPRTPILTAALPWIIVSIGERILLGSGTVLRWLFAQLRPVTDIADAVTGPRLWLGLLAAAVLVAVVIRLRRWRDDT